MSELPSGDEAAPALQMIRRVGGQPLVVRMVEAFLAAAPGTLAAARAAALHGDAGVVKTACHSLKSSAAQLGALRLSAACARLEQSADGRPPGELAALVDELDTELGAARSRLERELAPGSVT